MYGGQGLPSAFIEKHIRQIYDALDSSNSKQAITLSQKNLKKYPEHPIFKILYAYSLVASKKVDEANQIVNEVLTLEKLDVNSLSTLTVVLRKLNRREETCHLHSKLFDIFPKSEDIGEDYFYSLVRVNDYRKANQVALRLYTLHQTKKYYLWAIISLYNEVQMNAERVSGEKQPLDLILVEKMIKKALQEKKLSNFQEYSVVLLMNDKSNPEMKDLLDVPTSVFPTKLEYVKWKMNILYCLKSWQEIIQFVKSFNGLLILEDWELIVVYLEAVYRHHSTMEAKSTGHTTEETDPLSSLVHDQQAIATSLSHQRMYHFAEIEIAVRFNMGQKLSPQQAIENYFNLYGGKESCFPDLLPYLLKAPHQTFFQTFIKNSLTSNSLSNGDVEEQRKLICALKIDRFYAQKNEQGSDYVRLEYVCVDLLHLCNILKDSNGKLYTDLIIMHVIEMLGSESDTKIEIIDSLDIDMNTEILLKAAMMLISFIQIDDANFYLKLLLIFVLRDLCGPSLALKVYSSLNIKHVQVDILSFLVFDWIPIIGFQNEIQKMIHEIFSFYTSNEIETPDMIVEAYKNGSYAQLPEFIDFHLQLKYSITRKIADLSQIQIHSLALENKQDMIQYFSNEMTLPKLEKTIVDNRPIDDLLAYWTKFHHLHAFIKKSGMKDYVWIETSYILLATIKVAFCPNPETIKSFKTSDSIFYEHIYGLLNELIHAKYDDIEPIIIALFALVNDIYKEAYEDLTAKFMGIVNAIKKEVSDFKSTTPDSNLIKLESIVETIHYAVIFCVGIATYSSDKMPNIKTIVGEYISLCSELIHHCHLFLPQFPTKIDFSFLEGIVTDNIGKRVQELETSLKADWAVVVFSSKKAIEALKKILKSIL